MDDHWIRGYCPMGCGSTLRRRPADDKIVCQHSRCPRPTAVTELLDDPESEHVVTFEAEGFTVRHPLRERLDGGLMHCLLHEFLAGLPRPPRPDGRYRMVLDDRRHEYTYEDLGYPDADHR